MKKIAAIIPLVGIFYFSLSAYDYVYPVGVVDQEGGRLVFVMYQKSPDHTELWQWDPVTKEAQRALLSTFTPFGFSLLPDNAGFSFFDNGRLRIKNFLKRSPKAIDIYEPIYDIGPLQWVSIDTCIFHAKERERFSIYQLCASDGSVTKIVSNESSDCFHPSQRGDFLFSIEHRIDNNILDTGLGTGTTTYSIIRQSKGSKSEDSEAEISVEDQIERVELAQLEPSQVTVDPTKRILITHDKPLACLSMFNDHEGIVIEHPVGDIESQKDGMLKCTCYKFACSDTQGSLTKLFIFSLPLSLLLPSSKARLCESIYPLLPRCVGQSIYFVSSNIDSCAVGSVAGELRPFCYTPEQGVKPLSFDSEPFDFLFTPYPLHQGESESFVYGGLLQREFLHENQEPVESLVLL